MQRSTLVIAGLLAIGAWWWLSRPRQDAEAPSSPGAPDEPNATPNRPVTMDDLQLYVPLPVRQVMPGELNHGLL